MSGRSPRSIAAGLSVLGAVVLLLGAVTWPLLFTYSAFSQDWEHHLWLMWHQSSSLEWGHFPSFFVNSAYSVFNPTFGFYGGTLYALGGILSVALGGAPLQAYVLVYLLDFAAAFGGWYWLARGAGVGRWPAIVPGLVFITSTYYVMLVYVRGDWPEFTGVSTIPLMVAAALSVLRAERPHPAAVAALALSAIVFFGAHNLTVLLGLTTLGLTVLAVLACVPDARRLLTRGGVRRVAVVVVPAAAVSAWYLLPTLAYETRTRIGAEAGNGRELLRRTSGLVSLKHLFTFSRASAFGTSEPYPFALSLPVLAIAWVLVGVLVLPWGDRERTWTRLLLVCAGIGVLVGVAMTHVGILLALPRPYTLIQFSYRLETYVLLALCAAIVASLALARGGSWAARAWTLAAIPVSLVSLVGAIAQTRGYPDPGHDRYVGLQSFARVNTGDNQNYQDNSEPIIVGGDLRTIAFPFEAIHGDRASTSLRVAPGTLLATNIAAGPYMVNVTGATPVGLDSTDDLMVLRVDPVGGAARSGSTRASGGAATERTITVSTGTGVPIVLGRALSLCGLAILALELLVLPAYRLLRARVRGLGGKGAQWADGRQGS